MKKVWISLCIALALGGCASVPTNAPSEAEMKAGAANAYPDGDGFYDSVRAWSRDYFIDPYSLKFEYCREANSAFMERPHWAYSRSEKHNVIGKIIQVCINGKNKFGAYTGKRKFSFFFVDKKLRHVFEHYRSDGSVIGKFHEIP